MAKFKIGDRVYFEDGPDGKKMYGTVLEDDDLPWIEFDDAIGASDVSICGGTRGHCRCVDETRLHPAETLQDRLAASLRVAVARVEMAHEEGATILAKWLPEAKALIEQAEKSHARES